MQLRFVVWEFVRLMVQLEDNLKKNPHDKDLKSLYQQWDDIWLDLDRKLVNEGHDNPDRFAHLMMEQEVVCEDVSGHDLQLVIALLTEVVQTISQSLMHIDDEEEMTNLSYERDNLQNWITRHK